MRVLHVDLFLKPCSCEGLCLCAAAQDWVVITVFSLPVILIDEVLKLIGRISADRALAARMHGKKHN